MLQQLCGKRGNSVTRHGAPVAKRRAASRRWSCHCPERQPPSVNGMQCSPGPYYHMVTLNSGGRTSAMGWSWHGHPGRWRDSQCTPRTSDGMTEKVSVATRPRPDHPLSTVPVSVSVSVGGGHSLAAWRAGVARAGAESPRCGRVAHRFSAHASLESCGALARAFTAVLLLSACTPYSSASLTPVDHSTTCHGANTWLYVAGLPSASAVGAPYGIPSTCGPGELQRVMSTCSAAHGFLWQAHVPCSALRMPVGRSVLCAWRCGAGIWRYVAGSPNAP